MLSPGKFRVVVSTERFQNCHFAFGLLDKFFLYSTSSQITISYVCKDVM